MLYRKFGRAASAEDAESATTDGWAGGIGVSVVAFEVPLHLRGSLGCVRELC